jgi:putative CocE/NonD family hydrolase
MIYSVAEPATPRQRLAGGVELASSVWRPAAPGRFPALLMRQPYGRAIASTIVLAHPAWYAARGYIVVVQDVRGSGDSGGELRVFENEADDGAAAVDWAAGLPGCDGRVGMYGFSYHGTAQLLALSKASPALAAIAPAMAGWTLRTDWAYENGAYRLAMNLGWALHLGAIAARRRGDSAVFAALKAASGALPLGGAIPARPEILRLLGATHPHEDWMAEPGDSAYWRGIAPAALLDGRWDVASIPMLHIGGWYDFLLGGTLDAFHAFDNPEHELLIGPWAHLPWSSRVGDADFGSEAASPVDAALVAFFDRHLKGIASEEGAARARLFDLGAKTWRRGSGWPETREVSMFLSTKGNAAIRHDEGELDAEARSHGVDRIVHDPWQPVPSLGGHGSPAPGPRDRSALDARFDVLTYTSPPLEETLTIAGEVVLELYAESDAADFDVHAVLSVLGADGRGFDFMQAHCRVGAAAAMPLTLPMRATMMTVAAGGRLRLSLAGASFPAYPVNPGTGAAPVDAEAIECRPITIAVHSGGSTPSRLRLRVSREP